MSFWLKQSTAATIKMGPFLDATDGVTAEVALTVAQTDIRITKNGAAFAQTHNTAGAAHDENGYYGVPLDTTDTDTVGRLRVAVAKTGALPVWQDFVVVPANAYDSLIGGTANLSVNLIAGQLTFKKNVARTNFIFPLFDATGALKPSATVTVQIVKDSGSFATMAGSVTEISAGFYRVDWAQAETNADTIGFKATATGAIPTVYTIITQP